jgi:signal transduction histidine kinase/CheY-like chemotaxis protein
VTSTALHEFYTISHPPSLIPALPLTSPRPQAQRELIGSLTLCHGRSGRHHSSEDLELSRELARRGAIAVEQARLYRATIDAARRAEDANRVKDEFLAIASHELRTPLNAILGWAHLLEGKRVEDPAFVSRGLDVIRRNAQAQRELIEDILDVSRILSGKLRLAIGPIDLAQVVRDAVEVVRPAAIAKEIRIETDGVPTELRCAGDPARLQQVAWNLLANAVKFTPKGGRVTVEARHEDAAVSLRVTDNGIGIAPTVLPFVFERFRQADSSTTRLHGGLGLGLSIVRHLVELHGGTVSARSEGRGHGATFEVLFPNSLGRIERSAQGTNASTSDDAASPPSLNEVRVLVVDDAPDSREVVVVLLEGAGATVRVAGHADEAIELYGREVFDVVISDIAMPTVDGYALLGMLQKCASNRNRALRAIALTALGRNEDRENTSRAGFAAHLTKPVNPRELLATLARVLHPSPQAAERTAEARLRREPNGG